jgi:hypothetical protein
MVQTLVWGASLIDDGYCTFDVFLTWIALPTPIIACVIFLGAWDLHIYFGCLSVGL